MAEITHMLGNPKCHYRVQQLKLHNLCKRRYHLESPSLLQVYLGSKFCPLLETVGLRVPAQYSRDISLFNVCSSSKNCPSARCASEADVILQDVNAFGTKIVFLNHIL
jgi:hypothetical protein